MKDLERPYFVYFKDTLRKRYLILKVTEKIVYVWDIQKGEWVKFNTDNL